MMLESNGSCTDPKRIKGLIEQECPRTPKGIKSYIGSYQYLASSLPNATTADLRILQAVAAKPNKHKLVLNDKIKAAFEGTKKTLGNWILLAPLTPGAKTWV